MRPNIAAGAILVSLALAATGCASAPEPGGWQKIGGPLRNVSGMALVFHGPQKVGANTPRFLVVHDNKNAGEPRVGLVNVGGPAPLRPVAYTPLRWHGAELPIDLEAICQVPGTPGSYLAATSAGKLLHLRESGGGIDVLHESILPGLKKLPEIEGFAVQSVGGETVAVWAARGQGDEPGVVYYGTYDPVADVVKLAGKADVKVPFPAGPHTRHVSDLRIDRAGVVWGTAASDPPGDRGPFESALYELGTIGLKGGKVAFDPNPQPAPRWKTTRKVEAFELMPGDEGLVYFGADDELAGGWVYIGRRR